jgi:hypothetical protein
MKHKKTNATKKYCLLKPQNKPTATEFAGTLATMTSLRSKSKGVGGGLEREGEGGG